MIMAWREVLSDTRVEVSRLPGCMLALGAKTRDLIDASTKQRAAY